jgi:hypothetical protein
MERHCEIDRGLARAARLTRIEDVAPVRFGARGSHRSRYLYPLTRIPHQFVEGRALGGSLFLSN